MSRRHDLFAQTVAATTALREARQRDEASEHGRMRFEARELLRCTASMEERKFLCRLMKQACINRSNYESAALFRVEQKAAKKAALKED